MNAIWVKSSFSFSNGNCAEVASLPGGEIGVRDGRDPDGPVLTFTPGAWDAFVGRTRLPAVDPELDEVGKTAPRGIAASRCSATGRS
jgi:Domain of unknown function (DUF397)